MMSPTSSTFRASKGFEDHDGDPMVATALLGDSEVAPPPLRRDAARNRDKILTAARVAFDEEGFDIGVDAIAQRAGVGVGTVYRRFPTKELLIEAVVGEVLGKVLGAARSALEERSPEEGLATYIRAVGWLQFEHSGCLARLWNDSHTEVRDQIESVTRELLARAQRAGSVRPELVYEDVVVLLWSLRGVIETIASVSSDGWLRHLDLLLSSLAPNGEPLQHPPLTPAQIRAAKRAQGHNGNPRHPSSD
jgi:AcrR family transcriptional regulator